MSHQIDVTNVHHLLREARELAAGVGGLEVNDPYEVGGDARSHRREQKARVTRDLLRAADICTLAGALLREQYWLVKGYADPTDLD